MQDSETRRRVFWLLKRLTSYSLWAKKRDAWEVFSRAFENAVRTWPKNDPSGWTPICSPESTKR
ncbi:Imm71 family immunity protein [Paraburkholderia graminis]|uniref:Imm71 family immunity protein n=1 Tax=Paraburkholderia graminis TaxID=60548 RepID=UPI001FC95298|nr:Imm71 family immunity protein [Paraburkholderia graminis]